MADFQRTEGRARFMDQMTCDGVFAPSEPPTIAESAKRAGAAGDGSTLLYVHPMTPSHSYVTKEIDDGLGGKKLHLFSVRAGATSVNPRGPQTTDTATADHGDRLEHAHNRAHAERVKAFWRARDL